MIQANPTQTSAAKTCQDSIPHLFFVIDPHDLPNSSVALTDAQRVSAGRIFGHYFDGDSSVVFRAIHLSLS
jgi:hypothetical protein